MDYSPIASEINQSDFGQESTHVHVNNSDKSKESVGIYNIVTVCNTNHNPIVPGDRIPFLC